MTQKLHGGDTAASNRELRLQKSSISPKESELEDAIPHILIRQEDGVHQRQLENQDARSKLPGAEPRGRVDQGST